MADRRIRIQKVLSAAGVASRRAVEEMILAGRITVNGEAVESLPCFVEERDKILLDGQPVRKRAASNKYFLLNKPKNVICTQHDPAGRRRAIDLLPPMTERLYCVGRLDADSTGLVLLTNDGELTQHLTHPSFEVVKTYQVEIDGNLTPKEIAAFKRGVWLEGRRTKPAMLRILRRGPTRSVIEVRLSEGRNREIRRVLTRLGRSVRRLRRTAIGPVSDRGLKVGGVRELTVGEVAQLRRAGQRRGGKSQHPRGAKRTTGDNR